MPNETFFLHGTKKKSQTIRLQFSNWFVIVPVVFTSYSLLRVKRSSHHVAPRTCIDLVYASYSTAGRVILLVCKLKPRKLENLAITNALQLEAARARPALSHLIKTPCQVWSRWTYQLPYYSVFAADVLPYAVSLRFDLVTSTLNICSVSPVTWWNSVFNLNAPLRTVCQSCPTPKIARRKRAKWSITQRWIICFRSNFVQSLNAWHPKCCKSFKVNRSKITITAWHNVSASKTL